MKTIPFLLLFLLTGFILFAQQPSIDLDVPDQNVRLNLQIPEKDICHADDLIVDGSINIGIDAVCNRNFGFDTQVLSENNLRILFEDTSNSASFPTNDWRMTINDSSNGGLNHFSIDDVTGGQGGVFRIEAGADANSIYIDATNRVGIGRANPVVELHIADGDTPTLRLEQDGTSGFTPQTWDVAGNETNFFIRDATNSSRLPFRIRPGALTSSIDISANGDVGINNSSADAQLDVIAPAADVVVAEFSSGDPFAYIRFRDGMSTADQEPVIGAHEDTLEFVSTAGFHFKTSFETPGGSLLTLLSDGKMGIGTNAPTEMLHVVGNIAKTGNIVGASDRRLKTNIRSITNALDIVNALDGKSYNYRTGSYKTLNLPAGKHYGLIAQDVENVLKDIVTDDLMVTSDNNGHKEYMKGINYEALTPILINAIKEQQQLISTYEQIMEDHAALIDQLAQTNKSILDRLARLEGHTLSKDTKVSEE